MKKNPGTLGTPGGRPPPSAAEIRVESSPPVTPAEVAGIEGLERIDFVADTKIVKPSVAYKRYCDAYTYRVSELIFGSLLASYILGFVAVGTGLAHSTSSPLDMGWWLIITSTNFNFLVQAMCISLCFSYLTAAFYLTYHSSILTMPQFKSSNLRWDFTIAILQAVLFGISMIRLELFPAMIGLSVLIVFRRQQRAFLQLSEHFWRHSVGEGLNLEGNEGRRRRKDFCVAIRRINPDYHNCMAGWLPVSVLFWFAALFLFAAGVTIAYLQWRNRFPLYFQSLSYVILTGFIFWLASRVFLKSHELPRTVKGLRIDEAVVKLVERIRDAHRE